MNINYYALAIATGLTHQQAELFATAMTHKDKTDINHLKINETLN